MAVVNVVTGHADLHVSWSQKKNVGSLYCTLGK
jgi:hypothetical protein